MEKKALRGSLLLLIGAAIWGCAFVAQNVGMDYVEPFTFNGLRSFIGVLTLLPFVIVSDSKERLGKTEQQIRTKKRHDLKVILIAGAAVFIPTTLQQIGLVTTSPGKSGFITAMYIVIVPILSMIIGKRPPKYIFISVILSVVGLYLLCVTERLTIGSGDILTLISVLFWAIQIMLVDRFAPDINPMKLVCGEFLVCGLLSVICIALFEQPSLSGIMKCWLPLLYTGVLSTGIAYTLQAAGQRDTPPTIAALIMSMESVFAVLFGFIILGDRLTVRELIGCLLMLTAVVLAQLRFDHSKASVEEAIG